MEEDFKKAWEDYFSPKKSSLTEAQIVAYEKFALSNRDRAKAFINSVQTQLKMNFKDKRILDIGSAYGGFVICCAQIGAKAYGIEILEYLHELAVANARNEKGLIKLINMDVLDDRVLHETENQPFDLIIINDVFEHIYDSLALFHRIKSLRNPSTIVYFEIPNGESWQGIENEGHKFQFGLTLLEPGIWPKELGPFNIYYRPLEYYQIHFQHIGFPHMYLTVNKDSLETSKERVKNKFAELEEKINSGPFDSNFQNEQAKHKINLLRQRMENDLKENLLNIHLLYDQYFWKGYATQEKIPELENNNDLVRISFKSSNRNKSFEMITFLHTIKQKFTRY